MVAVINLPCDGSDSFVGYQSAAKLVKLVGPIPSIIPGGLVIPAQSWAPYHHGNRFCTTLYGINHKIGSAGMHFRIKFIFVHNWNSNYNFSWRRTNWVLEYYSFQQRIYRDLELCNIQYPASTDLRGKKCSQRIPIQRHGTDKSFTASNVSARCYCLCGLCNICYISS